jgi:hypothetical protein
MMIIALKEKENTHTYFIRFVACNQQKKKKKIRKREMKWKGFCEAHSFYMFLVYRYFKIVIMVVVNLSRFVFIFLCILK